MRHTSLLCQSVSFQTALYQLPWGACSTVTFLPLHLAGYFFIYLLDFLFITGMETLWENLWASQKVHKMWTSPSFKFRLLNVRCITGLRRQLVLILFFIPKFQCGLKLLVHERGRMGTGCVTRLMTCCHWETSLKAHASDMWAFYRLMVSDENENILRQFSTAILRREGIKTDLIPLSSSCAEDISKTRMLDII